LSVVAIRCPTCGSAAASTANPGEYVCGHCNTRFQIVHPSATLISDSKAHHCPICGRPVNALGSYKCTECGTMDFCSRCVTAVPLKKTERFVCKNCITKKGWGCSECGDYAQTTCVVCSRKTCQQHSDKYFGLEIGRERKVYYTNCPTCRGPTCVSCTEIKEGLFSPRRYYCKRCRSEVTLLPRLAASCKFCGMGVAPTAVFCPSCGKARV
jgi:DNA-directed RNA polymerase subunit RPC12/RpoP